MSFHVRRKDREITDSDALKQVLKSTKYVTIALCMDNEPYLVSLSHGYDEPRNCLYFHCADEGKKLVYLKANSKVWGHAVQDARAKLAKTTMDRIDVSYMTGKKHQYPEP
jgi:nitroimidazol reductase NimA-like FMN-containing flavoprotein (pyridoxamine 5'-phosphate oxidase superfamily)